MANEFRDSGGRIVVDVEFESNGDGSAYVSSAKYDDDGSTVPENEIDYLTDAYPESCDEYAFESAVMAAESYYEGDR